MHHLEPIRFSDDKTFERFICDYLSIKLGVNFTTFGRNGQKQDGIDGLHYNPDNDHHYNVVQCKNYNTINLKYDEIVEHLETVHKSSLKVDKFYFVTASNKDVGLQKKFQENYDYLANKYEFSIELLYYSDIFREVIGSYHDLAKKYSLPYEGFLQYKDDVAKKKERDLYHLFNIAYNTETSFYNLPYYIELFASKCNSQYSSFSTAITILWERTPDGSVFYDNKLNEYLSMFIDYDRMVYDILIPNFSPTDSGQHEYIMDEQARCEIQRRLRMRIENYSYTFYKFIAYLKDNYLEFDTTKCYYDAPSK